MRYNTPWPEPVVAALQVLYKVALILVEVMGEWRRMLEDEQSWKGHQPHDAGALTLDLPRVEGYALSILCNNSVQACMLSALARHGFYF